MPFHIELKTPKQVIWWWWRRAVWIHDI